MLGYGCKKIFRKFFGLCKVGPLLRDACLSQNSRTIPIGSLRLPRLFISLVKCSQWNNYFRGATLIMKGNELLWSVNFPTALKMRGKSWTKSEEEYTFFYKQPGC